MTDYYDVGVKRANVASLTEAGVALRRGRPALLRLAPFVEGVEVVHHQAAQPGVRNSWAERFTDYAGHNVLGTQRLLEAARHAGVHRFVYASSSSSTATPSPTRPSRRRCRRPSAPPASPSWPPSTSAGPTRSTSGWPRVSLRYFTVYGPRQRPDMSIHRLIEAALGGTGFPLFGDGTQVRELTHVDRRHRRRPPRRVRGGEPGSVFNISGGSRDRRSRPDRARRGRGRRSDRRRGPPGGARRRAAQRRLDRAGPRAARLATVGQPGGRHPQPGGLAPRPSPLTLSAGAGAP